ncbi:motility associated factor glycosyltransferase family protein [Lysinibacillus sp. NPDC097162]|uniref:motility associated factor glycosyltransferase family protein n=1 Tax=Lysinibacillus sp. NPDC097162 TaxID=3364140 RepID=UPI00381EE67C
MSKYQIEILSTKTNLETVKVNGYLLHSKYDPIREAKMVAEREYEVLDVLILFGYGLGYIAEAINNKIEKSQKLIIIDPLYKYLNSSISKTNFNIIYEYDQKSIEYIVANSMNNLSQKIKVIVSPNYENIFKEELLELLKIIKNIQNVHKVMENTIKEFSDSWQENYIHNLIHLDEDSSLGKLKKMYNCPVILISGGPSLTKQLQILDKIKKNVITIAAGSTINTLLEYGIEPDYIVTIDGGEVNYLHFKDIKNIKSELIFCLSSYYKIQDRYQNTKYAFLTPDDEDIQKYIKKVFDIELPIFSGGGSVANFALSIASYISTGPVAIIGQDLAYTDSKSHAENNKNFLIIDGKFQEENELFEVEGYSGEKVLTDYPLFSMKKDFERLNEILSQSTMIFNCTEGGVKIERMQQMSFIAFCNKYVNRDVQLNKIQSKQKFNTYNNSKLIDILLQEVKIYDELIRSLKLSLKILERNKSNVLFDKNVLKELNKVDKEFISKKDFTSINRIVDPITIDVLRKFQPISNENPEEKYRRVYNQNKELYSRLQEAIEKTKGYTLDVIEKAKKYEV